MTIKLTGKWLNNKDPKEVVVKVWPKLEEFLAKKEFVFYPEHNIVLPTQGLKYWLSNSINKYNRKIVGGYDYEIDGFYPEDEESLIEIREDFLKSRRKFIGKIDSFRYMESTSTRGLTNVPITTNISINHIELSYMDNHNNTLIFYILPGEYVPSYEQYVGIYLNSKTRNKQRKFIERATNASNLIVEVDSGNSKLDKEIRKEYRIIRKKIEGDRK